MGRAHGLCVVGCALLVAGALTGCPGDYQPNTRRDGSNAVTDSSGGGVFDAPPTFDKGGSTQPDSAPKPDSAPGCSATGTKASCDPVAQTGCPANAACYVVRNIGAACVCPPGAKTEGTQCTTTTECARGLGCAGDVAPGNCRRFCQPAPAPNACGSKKCTPLTPFPQYGFCI